MFLFNYLFGMLKYITPSIHLIYGFVYAFLDETHKRFLLIPLYYTFDSLRTNSYNYFLYIFPYLVIIMSDNHTSFRSSTTTYLPSYSTCKPQNIQARNEPKLETNYAHKQKYPPFVVPPSIYHVVFLNKRTGI